MRSLAIPTLILAAWSSTARAQQSASMNEYTLGWRDPATHLYDVSLSFMPESQDSVDVHLPIWRPGRYVRQNYAANVQEFSAGDGERALAFRKSGLSTWRVAPGHDSAKTAAMKADGQREGSPFKALARKYGVTEAQVLLRWGVQRGYPVLPQSTDPERMRQNADIFSFAIDDGDMKEIAAMDRGDGVAWSVGDPTRAA